jgi:hypothetical protein
VVACSWIFGGYSLDWDEPTHYKLGPVSRRSCVWNRASEGDMIEGFLRGRGQSPAPPSNAEFEIPQPQRGSLWTVVWIICGGLVVVAGFGIHYYLSHKSFSITGHIFYKPEVEAQDGALERGAYIVPVQGATVIVYAHPLGSPEDFMKYYLAVDRLFPVDPRQYSNFGSLSPESRQGAMKHWQGEIDNWNWRRYDCRQVMDHAIKLPELARTYTDATGQFSLKLKQGVYSIFVSSYVPSFLMGYDGKLSPTTAYVFWQEQLKVPDEAKLVYAEPACSPR